MALLSRASSLWRNLTRKPRVESDLDDELQGYIEMLAARFREDGMSEPEAWRAARVEAGGLDQVKEEVRDVRAGHFLETLMQDVRGGVRFLLRSRGVSMAAILSLAVGIGLNVAIFSAVNSVILRPLPYSEPERLVEIAQTLKWYMNGAANGGIAPANFLDWERTAQSFERMAIYDRLNFRYTLSAPQGKFAVTGYHVSAGFFPVLKTQAAIGRTFLPEEDRPDSDVVVITHDLWRRAFGSDPGIAGKTAVIDGQTYTVVGVLPESFAFYQPPTMAAEKPRLDLFLPYAFQHNSPANRQYFLNSAIARLKPGVTVEEARAELSRIAAGLVEMHPKENADSGAWVSPLTLVDAAQRKSLGIAWGAIGLVLLIACANVSGLFLVRTDSRRHELGVRTALGAGRGRLIRQLLTESTVIAIAGGFGGLLLALAASRLLPVFLPNAERISRLDEASIDGRVIVFAALLSITAGLLCGLIPAIRGSRVQLLASVKETARTGATVGRTRFRNALIVVQVAFSVVLLVGAALMIHSLWRLNRVKLGFDPDGLITMESRLPLTPQYAKRLEGFAEAVPGRSTKVPRWALTDGAIQFPDNAAERLRAVPGVAVAAVASGAPMIQSMNNSFAIEGHAGNPPSAYVWNVTAGYFDAMRIRVSQGRAFDARDTANSLPVVIVNDVMAKKWWPGRSAVVGERVLVGRQRKPHEVVGVVNAVRAWPKREPVEEMYIPMSQNLENGNAYIDLLMKRRLKFIYVLRAQSSDPAVISAAVRALEQAAGGAPVERVRAMSDVLDEAFGPWRSTMFLMMLAGGLSLLLAAVGIYSMISYTVTRRTNEIGIRAALGASRAGLIWLVMKSSLLCALIGTAVGLWAAAGLTDLIAAQLFDVVPMDPLSFGAAILVLLGAALLAGYLPSRRAAKLDPVTALRHE